MALIDLSKQIALGIDIGGTNTKYGFVNHRGEILEKGSLKTDEYEKVEDFIDALYTTISPLMKKHCSQRQIDGIGVGAPNANYYTGTIEHAPNLRWKGVVPFAELMTKKFGLPCTMTNDANAAALGEMMFGAARGMKDFIMITLGTGVGSGIVANGQLIYGHDGFAGELGHITVRRNTGRLCGCGRVGCLEAYTSATGVVRTAREYLELKPDAQSLLRKIPIDKITSKDVFDAAVEGDEMALEIFRFTGEMLGEAFSDFVAFTSPEAIILFGGLAKAGDLIMNPIRETMEKNLLKIYKDKVKLLFSELKESDAAVLGASALGWEVRGD